MAPCQRKHYQRKIALYNEHIRRCQTVIDGALTIQIIEEEEYKIKFYLGLINQVNFLLRIEDDD